jgi:hypothetical protein
MVVSDSFAEFLRAWAPAPVLISGIYQAPIARRRTVIIRPYLFHVVYQ